MKTSMSYRMFRIYFNDHADNFELFGSRVYNPENLDRDHPAEKLKSAALLRTLMAAMIIGCILYWMYGS